MIEALEFALVLLQAILTYLLAALVFPDIGAEEHVDLRSHYLEQVPWFFGIGVAVLIVSVAKDLVIFGTWLAPINLAFHILVIALWTSAALIRRETFHRALAWVMMIAIIAYVWLLYARL